MDKTSQQLLRLESVITNEKSIIKLGTQAGLFKKATRVANHRRKEATHRLELNIVTNVLSWVNNRRGGWEHQFASNQQANEWWQNMVLQRAAKPIEEGAQ